MERKVEMLEILSSGLQKIGGHERSIIGSQLHTVLARKADQKPSPEET